MSEEEFLLKVLQIQENNDYYSEILFMKYWFMRNIMKNIG